MKHKPMLLKKLDLTICGRTREVIGLIGTHHGVGVTHTGLMLAFYMGEELGRKTALLECNNHQDLNLLEQSFEWTKGDIRTFSFGQITCYKEVTSEQIADIFGEDYECVILDFGTELIKNKEEFLRCGTKLVIGGRSEWDRLKLVRFMEASKAYRGNDTWRYLMPLAKEKKLRAISNELSQRVWSVPENDEPTLTSYQTNRFFEELFRV